MPAFDKAASAAVNAERMAARRGLDLRTRTEGEIRGAGKLLAEMYASSPVAIDGPTPERARQAGADFEVSEAVRSVEVVKDGRPQTEQIRTPRVRVGEDPFTRMVLRGQLAPESEVVNGDLGAAGLRYRRLHEGAGRNGLKAQDLTRGFSTAGTASDVLDRMLDDWSGWDAAQRSVPMRMRRTLDEIVLQGVKPEDAHLPTGGYTNPKYRVVAVMTLLRHALQDLVQHFAAVDAGRQ